MDYIYKYKKYAEALYQALGEDAFYITMEKSVEKETSSKEAMLRYLEFSMIESENSGELYIPKDHDYGVSVWSKPVSREVEAEKSSIKKKFILNQMGEQSLQTYNEIVEFMSCQAEPYINDNFWYLSILGVLPEYQGQGLGPALVLNMLKKTDHLKVSTYLETFTPRNMSFYRRLGYKEIQSFSEPVTGADYWLMVRVPPIA